MALLSRPCMLLGVSIGVICNRVLPEWLITILFAVFLGFCTFKTCKSGFFYWKLENGNQELEHGLLKNESSDETAEPLLKKETEGGISSIPWMKMGVLVMFWFSFFFLYLLREIDGQGIIPMETCSGVLDHLISSSFLWLYLPIHGSCIIESRQQHMLSKKQEGTSETKHGPSGKLIFPIMALLAGILGGVFGIGGGMLISPLLIQVGITPEVTAATCSFMVFFSSTMSAVQYLFLGMEHVDYALIFAVVCCVASIIGLVVVQRAIAHHGRASLIVFSVGIVMALSTVLMTSFGAVDIWRDYTDGNYMGSSGPVEKIKGGILKMVQFKAWSKCWIFMLYKEIDAS
ncbi:hypothetical protein HAX54_004725 [Datura stramonium]|uniref:Sulfite exporter TauE/SafE family protein n=1 Tax=Datura stramonium TaxID=4076 RepID=A0ABS8T861_DATST|nr:hypothetical protein [Datura stramonium]